MRSQKGFTLIELLVVVGIIGLVGVLAAVAVNVARSKQRDATRLSQVRQVQSALEDFFNETNTYPAGLGLPLGDARISGCLSTDGFKGNCEGDEAVLLRVVSPTIDNGLRGLVTCGEPARNALCYGQALDGATYAIEFELENRLPEVSLIEGVNCATPEGMEGGRCQ